jgi:hypothetical protein
MGRCGILLLLILIIHLPGLPPGGGYMCKVGCTVWDMPDSLVLETVRFEPKPRIYGNYLVGELLVRSLFRVFRFNLQVY